MYIAGNPHDCERAGFSFPAQDLRPRKIAVLMKQPVEMNSSRDTGIFFFIEDNLQQNSILLL
jgi:hypothetical protein